jgi:hypothetical protein
VCGDKPDNSQAILGDTPSPRECGDKPPSGGSMAYGQEYFWLVERAVNHYPWLSRDEREEVIAEAVFTAYVVPHPLSYALVIWSVRRAINVHIISLYQYPHISLHLVRDKVWHIDPPEIRENNLVDLSQYRQRKRAMLSVA